MGIVRNLLVRVGVDLSDMQKKLKAAQKSFKNLSKDLNQIGQGMTKSLTVPIVAVTSAFAMMGLKAAKAADDLADMSLVTNIGVEDLQAYAFAGDILGTNLDTITGAQTKLTRAIAEAHGGNKEAIKNFETLGVKIYDASGNLRTADEIFWDVIDALGKIEDPVLRDALAMELMGKSAQELNPIIAAGSDKFKELMERAKELGIVMGEDQVNNLASLNDAWATLQAQFAAIGNVIMAALAPALLEIVNAVSDKLPAITQGLVDLVNGFLGLDPGIQGFILGAIGLLAALGPVLMILGAVAGAISGVIGWVAGIVGAFSAFGAGTGTLGAILTAVFGSVGGVILATVAIIAGLILIFNQLWNTNEEFRNKVTEIWNNIKAVVTPIIQTIWDFIKLAWTEISKLVKDNMGTIREIVKTVWGIVVEIFKVQLNLISSTVKVVIAALKSYWENWGFVFKSIIDGIWTAVKGIFTGALKIIEGLLKIALGVITGDWNKAWEGVGKVWDGIWDAIIGVVEGATKIIYGIVGGIIDKVASAIEAVKSLIGLNSEASKNQPTVTNDGGGSLQSGLKAGIPKLANGGILTRPTLNIAGEAGPEAVIPLSKLDSMIGSGSKETIVQVILDGRVVQEFVDNGLGVKSLSFGGAY